MISKQINVQGDIFHVFLDDREAVGTGSGGLTDRSELPPSVQVKTLGNLMLLRVNRSNA